MTLRAHQPAPEAHRRYFVHRAYRVALPVERRLPLLGFLSVLMEFASDAEVHETRAELAAATGRSERVVKGLEDELAALGLLSIEPGAGRRRVLRIQPAPRTTLTQVPPQPLAGGQVAQVGASRGRDPFSPEQRGETSERSEESRKGGGEPPSRPPGAAERIYERLQELLGDDPEALHRVECLVATYGERGTDAWVRECIRHASKRARSARGPGPLLRRVLMEDEVPRRFHHMPDPEEERHQRRLERVAAIPGDPACPHCKNGWGHIVVAPGETPPPGATFMAHTVTGTDWYACACCAQGGKG